VVFVSFGEEKAVMTLDEFFASYVNLIQKRHDAALAAAPHAQQLTILLAKLKAGGTAQLPNLAYNYLFVFPPASSGAPLGSCTYFIANKPFCLDNVTRDECDNMPGGVWSPNACPFQIVYQ
jgi:hypothetical protein